MTTEGRPRERDPRARALAVAAAGALLLVIVAAAASGGFALRDREGSGDLVAPRLPGYAAWILIPLLFVAVMGSMAVLTRVVKGRRITRPARAPLWVQFATLILVVLSIVALEKAGILGRLAGRGGRQEVAPGATPFPARPEDAAGRVAHSATLGVVVTVILVAILGTVIAVTWSALRKERAEAGDADEEERSALLTGLDLGMDDLARIEDPRAAVIACYARMEGALAGAGIARHESEAPIEFLTRVLVERDVLASSAGTLTRLFERARYSEHAVDESTRSDALESLRVVRDELRSVSV